MAIVPNRLDITTVTKLNKVDFEDKKDEISVTSPSKQQVGPTVEAAKAMVNNEQPKHGIVSTEANSMFNGDKIVPANKKIKKSKNSLSKTDDLTFSISDVLKKKGRQDNIFELTPASDKKLDNMISIKLKDAKKKYPNLNTNDISKDVKSNVHKRLNSMISDTIKSKKNLIGSLKDCFSMNDLNLSFNLENLIDLSILDSIDCAGIDKFIMGMGDIGKGIATLAKSMITPNSSKTVDKLLYSKILKESINEPGALIKANTSTKGTITKVLENLSNSNYKSNSNKSVTKDLYSSLDIYDPNWKKDDLGEVNYFKVKNNDFIIGNAVNYNENKFTMPTTPTNEVNTVLDESLSIAVINA